MSSLQSSALSPPSSGESPAVCLLSAAESNSRKLDKVGREPRKAVDKSGKNTRDVTAASNCGGRARCCCAQAKLAIETAPVIASINGSREENTRMVLARAIGSG